MEVTIVLCYFLLLVYPTVANNGAVKYTHVVTFGDSTSDSGVGYQLSNHTWPPIPPYNSNGGYADGLLWNEILTQKFLSNTILQNYACGSATTDNRLAQGFMNRNPNIIANYTIRNNTKSPGVRQQILQYINSTINQNIDFNQILYIIWAGTNNYFFNKSLTAFDTVESLIDCLDLLIRFGSRHIIIINEPPFDRFPGLRNQNETNTTKQLYIEHNKILNTKFNENYSLSCTKLNIRLFDSYSFVSNIMNSYTNYGFENLDNCWDTIHNSTVQLLCLNVTKRMFCDEYHLATQMQSYIAQELYDFIVIGLNSTVHSEATTIRSGINNQITVHFCLLIFMLINIFLFK